MVLAQEIGPPEAVLLMFACMALGPVAGVAACVGGFLRARVATIVLSSVAVLAAAGVFLLILHGHHFSLVFYLSSTARNWPFAALFEGVPILLAGSAVVICRWRCRKIK